MMTLDADATFVRLDRLRERMTRLEQTPDQNEWQFTRLLIRAFAEGLAKLKKSRIPVTRKIRVDAPEAVSSDWKKLVLVLHKKGIKSESRRSALRRA